MTQLTRSLIEEIKNAPESVQRELLEFLKHLKSDPSSRNQGREDLLPLAQSAWAADWDSTEEDEAWRDL